MAQIDQRNMIYQISIPRSGFKYAQRPMTHLVQFMGRFPHKSDLDGFVPAIEKYAADLAGTAAAKQAISSGIACGYEIKTVTRLSALTDDIMDKALELEHALTDLGSSEDIVTESALVRDTILPKMCELRLPCDEAETMTAKSCWPYPTYSDLLFGV